MTTLNTVVPRLLPLLGAAWIGACAGGKSNDAAPSIAVDTSAALLAFHGDTSSVEVPNSARVGDSVAVRFHTFGGGCTRPGRVDVVVSGLRAEVRPYHVHPAADQKTEVVCTMELRFDPRVAHVRFDNPGSAIVRVIGLATPGDQPFVIERGLQIQPQDP
jgi:hypothetical protein